jgi:hypothetical protein
MDGIVKFVEFWTGLIVVVVVLFVLSVLKSFQGGMPPTASTGPMSYQELVSYPTQCVKADEQLAQLYALQQLKNFNSDPDELNEWDRAYNSRLKATIWWYTYECGKS